MKNLSMTKLKDMMNHYCFHDINMMSLLHDIMQQLCSKLNRTRKNHYNPYYYFYTMDRALPVEPPLCLCSRYRFRQCKSTPKLLPLRQLFNIRRAHYAQFHPLSFKRTSVRNTILQLCIEMHPICERMLNSSIKYWNICHISLFLSNQPCYFYP